MKSMYINLAVTDLPKATAFYQALGFIKHEQWSDEKASGMKFDDSLTVMLLTHEFMKTFLPAHKQIADTQKTCAALNALQLESKRAVDKFFETAIQAGATKTLEYDHGFMYGKDFEDLDGHIWELFCMDEASAEGSN